MFRGNFATVSIYFGIGMSIYRLKSGFQNLLRPLVGMLARNRVTANQVTVAAALLSVVLGVLLALTQNPAWFLLVPVNAVDGMLAREHGQQSPLGGYLNEIGDVVADAALYAPFALVAPFSAVWIGAVILLATLSEFAGVLGVAHGNSRRYDGPMGKSDRAAVFGVLGAWVGVSGSLPGWAFWLMPLMCLLLLLTTANRVRAGLRLEG
jgi:CDP-diacylglycerol---glycerol-3-phosphate 3-phosphatidyltransferase